MRHFPAIRTPISLKFDSFALLLLLSLLGFLSLPGKAFPEKEFLIEFKASLADPDGVLSDWVPLTDSGDPEHCSWNGVVCDNQFRVSSLQIIGGNNHLLVGGEGKDNDLSCFNVSEFPFYGVGIRRECSSRYGKLTGEIPPVIAKLKKLRVLSLPFHKFSGEIPSDIWGLEDLEVLDLEGNLLSGLLPVSFKGLGRLRVLNLGLNRIHGEIPGSLSRLVGLELLNLAANELDGSIPVFVGRYRKLWGLYLSMNRLKGELSNIWESNCRNLRYLDLSGNALYGEIPRSLGECLELRALLLSYNMLKGVTPSDLGWLRRLDVLYISRNRLCGRIPVDLGNCGDLSIHVLSNWKSIGSFRSCGGNGLFRGAIPTEIVALPKLQMLRWPKPQFQGEVTSVKVRKMANSRFLSELNPSSDESVPSSSVQSNAPQDLQTNDEPSSDEYNNSKKRLNTIEMGSIISASTIVFVLLVLIVIFLYTKKCASRDSSRIQVYDQRREIKFFMDIGVPLIYQHVVKATDCFSASKCIGCGGFGATYKAEISPGVVVAVKRLAVGRFHGIQQFHAEIKTLGRIRHDNLVTLIGYHASEMEMFLIYNYLPGGNLEKFIQERSSKLIKWNVIHKIALNVAQAIAYLHDECNPRVIHRDVKPSNILLDNDFNAYLSDFGLCRLLENSETHATTGVAGTFGYLAPEYAMTCRVSEKADVYSYGVVLLELISDKKALDPSFSSHGNGFNIVTWAHMLLRQGRAKEVFTEAIWESGPHDDLVEVLHLAVRCTVDSLTVRPTMKQAVQLLKQLRPIQLAVS